MDADGHPVARLPAIPLQVTKVGLPEMPDLGADVGVGSSDTGWGNIDSQRRRTTGGGELTLAASNSIQ